MVLTTFQNPACSPLPASQVYNPPSRATTLCLDISAKHKNDVLRYKQNNSSTNNQRFAYLSNINPPTKRTYAIQGDLGSNPNTHNLPTSRNGQIMTETCNS